MTDKTVREEIAELTTAVHDLRDNEVAAELRSLRAEVERLRAERATHHCTGCSCTHVHWYPQYQPLVAPGCAPQPTQVWYGTGTSGVAPDFTMTATNNVGAAAGYNPVVTLSVSN